MQWVVYSIVSGLLGYSLRCYGIPFILTQYRLPAIAWYWHYPIFEGLGVLWGALLRVQYPVSELNALFLMLLVWGLLMLAFIDIEHFLLPDIILKPLCLLGLFVNFYCELFTAGHISLLSSVIAYIGLSVFADGYYYSTGRVGLGRGDVKLFAVLGSWFGWTALPIILWIASCSGLFLSLIAFALKKQTYHQLIPFGPFLVWGSFCYLMRFHPLSTVL